MPLSPKKSCNAQGCNVLTRNPRYCDAHASIGKSVETKRRERQRETSAHRGYSYKWQQAREGWLRKHPLCVRCERAGLIEPAAVVDHVLPHRGDMTLFWARTNWQSLCSNCHNSYKQRLEKSGREVGCDVGGRPLDPQHHWNR